MKLRDLFKAFRHPEHESRCHELTEQERLDAAKRVDELLLSKSIISSAESRNLSAKTSREINETR